MSAHQRLTPQSAQDVTAIGATGWASNRLAQAYALVEAEQKERAQHPYRLVTSSLSDAMDAIEMADCDLAGAA